MVKSLRVLASLVLIFLVANVAGATEGSYYALDYISADHDPLVSVEKPSCPQGAHLSALNVYFVYSTNHIVTNISSVAGTFRKFGLDPSFGTCSSLTPIETCASWRVQISLRDAPSDAVLFEKLSLAQPIEIHAGPGQSASFAYSLKQRPADGPAVTVTDPSYLAQPGPFSFRLRKRIGQAAIGGSIEAMSSLHMEAVQVELQPVCN